MDEESKAKLKAFRRIVVKDAADAQIACIESILNRTLESDMPDEMKAEFIDILNQEFANVHANLAIAHATI
jgi:hypothetical protein